jgi:hypothetical protein
MKNKKCSNFSWKTLWITLKTGGKPGEELGTGWRRKPGALWKSGTRARFGGNPQSFTPKRSMVTNRFFNPLRLRVMNSASLWKTGIVENKNDFQ